MQILIFGDDKNTLKWISNQISEPSPSVFTVNALKVQEVMILLKSLHFDAIVLDIAASKNAGEIFRELVNNHSKVPVIVLTDYSNLLLAKETVKLGADTYLLKENTTKGTLTGCLQVLIAKRLELVKSSRKPGYSKQPY